MILTRDIQRSIWYSIKRNGLLATLSILRHYLVLKRSHDIYTLPTRLLPVPVYLRPGNSDFSVFRQIFMNGEYDIEIPFSPRIIVDAGANIGLASLYFSQQFPQAVIYSLEPDPDNFQMLSRHAQQYPQWKTFQLALWDQCTSLAFTNTQAEAWSKQVGQSAKASDSLVPAMDLTSFMLNNGIEVIDLLKIDIEGAEFEVFQHNYEYWLKRTRMIIVELHENLRPGVEKIFSHALQSIRYQRKVSGENIVIVNQDLL
jgi:FkbM family methyltransferase